MLNVVFSNTLQLLVTSKKASEIISMYTLFKPFDGFVWAATCVLLCFQTTILLIIRMTLKSLTSEGRFGSDHFQGTP